MHILIIEDEPTLRQQLLTRLQEDGNVAEGTGEGHEGLYLAHEYGFDAAVIDLGLPDLSGLEVIRRLRAEDNLLPILILTARDRWQDKVEGLEAGADDYLVKPFHPEELLARLRALVRRAGGNASQRIDLGPLHIDLTTQQVWIGQEPVNLTTYEYRLLEQFITNRGQVLSKQKLADHLYPHDEDRESNVIEVLIGRLRRKLDPAGHLNPIATVRGRGYRLVLNDSADSDSA